MKALLKKYKRMNRDFKIFLLISILFGITASIDGSTLANYLRESLNINIMERALIEIPRELPGFLVFFIVGILYAFGDVRIAAIANLFAATGMFLLGIIPREFNFVILSLFVYSIGQHIYLPLSSSIAMSFSDDKNFGKRLGQINSVNTAALLLSSVTLWIIFKFVKVNYTFIYIIGACTFIIIAFLFFSMTPKKSEKKVRGFVFRKEYKIYYILSILFGARKQIFLTFAPWVLVDTFHMKVTSMTLIFFTISFVGIFLKPFVGHLIDKYGERIILRSEAFILFFVCLLYAFATDIFSYKVSLIVIIACYIIDQSLNVVTLARATYVKKIALKEEDVSATLSLGISLDHLISMFIPSLAGYIWSIHGANGYKYVFMGGAAIALINFFVTNYINTNKIYSNTVGM